MSLIKVDEVKEFHYLTYPRITPVITSGTLEEPNAMAASWVSPLSVNPPLFGVAIAPRRYTYDLIKRYGEFGVCFLPIDMVDIVLKVGSISGRDTNKFAKFGIKIKKAEKIKCPLIDGSLSALECKVVKECDVGDHTFFVGEVVTVWAKEDIVEKGLFDIRKAKHVLYVGKGVFTTNSDKKFIP